MLHIPRGLRGLTTGDVTGEQGTQEVDFEVPS